MNSLTLSDSSLDITIGQVSQTGQDRSGQNENYSDDDLKLYQTLRSKKKFQSEKVILWCILLFKAKRETSLHLPSTP